MVELHGLGKTKGVAAASISKVLTAVALPGTEQTKEIDELRHPLEKCRLLINLPFRL